MTRFFITATGTDIGKTLITAALAWQFRQSKKNVKAIKPIASGFDENNPEQSDAGHLLAAQELPLTALDSISPWRFAAPLSPDMAAKAENKKVDFTALIKFCKASGEDVQLIEGVGGVMSPVTQTHTVLDWMEALSIPVILVTGSYVGTLSHTLTALHAIESRRLEVKRIVISESPHSEASLQQTCESLRQHLKQKIEIAVIPRLDSHTDLWKYEPNLMEGLL